MTYQPIENYGMEFTLSEGETAVFVLRHLSQQLGCGISTSAEKPKIHDGLRPRLATPSTITLGPSTLKDHWPPIARWIAAQ